jgi:hypothetical protein
MSTAEMSNMAGLKSYKLIEICFKTINFISIGNSHFLPKKPAEVSLLIAQDFRCSSLDPPCKASSGPRGNNHTGTEMRKRMCRHLATSTSVVRQLAARVRSLFLCEAVNEGVEALAHLPYGGKRLSSHIPLNTTLLLPDEQLEVTVSREDDLSSQCLKTGLWFEEGS